MSDTPDQEVAELSVEDAIAQLAAVASSIDQSGSVEFMARPKATRSPTTSVPWDDHLAFLTAYPSQSVALLKFAPNDAGKAKARSMAGTIRRQLIDAQPGELWTVDAQFTTEHWVVFVSFERERTEAEQQKLAEDKLASKQRALHAQEVAQAERADAEVRGMDIKDYRAAKKAGTLGAAPAAPQKVPAAKVPAAKKVAPAAPARRSR